jgi:trans-2,3-dihydro-3-hydroxyanthranilate isomerase
MSLSLLVLLHAGPYAEPRIAKHDRDHVMRGRAEAKPRRDPFSHDPPDLVLDVFAERPWRATASRWSIEPTIERRDDARLREETRLAETTFLQSTDTDGADYRNRIWDPHDELPFAGHPSLGTAVAVARWRGLEEASLVQETRAGLQPIEVRSDGERWRADMLQYEPEFGAELDPDAVMTAVGLRASDAHPELPPQIVSTGVPNLMAPVADHEALARALPDYSTIYELVEPYGSIVIYLAWCEPDQGRARARSYTRSADMGEDPATGSAAGPLGAYSPSARAASDS